MPKPKPNIRIPPPTRRPEKPTEQQTVILLPPESQFIEKGFSVTFSIVAAGYPPGQADELAYEWQFNKAPKAKPIENPSSKIWSDLEFFDKGFEKHPDSPNAPSFEISDVSKNDVAFYRVKVTPPGAKAVISKPAQLWVWEEVDSILVHGTVYQQTGGPKTCPGSYVKRVDYPAVWPDSATPRSAKDQHNFGTWIEWFDWYYAGACGVTPNPGQQIAVNVVNGSVPHYFTIYIPSGKATPTPYDIYLTNFS